MFDLDINNYSIKDLEKFFKLKSKYTRDDVELKEYTIRETLLKSGHVDKRLQTDLIKFLTAAKQLLIYRKIDLNTDDHKPFTTIPNNYKLDPYDIPLLKEPGSRESELIKRTDTQYIHTNNSEYFPGVLNPLNTRVITKCINIDTRFRDNISTGQCSDFTIQLPIKLSKVVSMQLASLEFPVCFYTISSFYGNNFLYLNVYYTPIDSPDSTAIVNTESTFVIPDGNYNAQDLISLLNTLLSPTNSDGSLVNPNSIFSYIQLTLDITNSGSGSGKVTIATTGTYAGNIKEFVMDFTRDINGNDDFIAPKIGNNLGFIKNMYYETTTYTADTIIDTASIRYIYLAVDDFSNRSNNHFISVFNNSYMSPDILARVSVNGSYYSLIMENDFNIVSEPRIYFGPVDIQKLRIRLFDDRGRILQMNNSNFSFCLNVKLLYDL